jgi:hypothetical protein
MFDNHSDSFLTLKMQCLSPCRTCFFVLRFSATTGLIFGALSIARVSPPDHLFIFLK